MKKYPIKIALILISLLASSCGNISEETNSLSVSESPSAITNSNSEASSPNSTSNLAEDSSSISDISNTSSQALLYPLVTFYVESPIELGAGDQIKIAGSFNVWNPFAEGYALTKVDEYNYTLTLTFSPEDAGKKIEYKYVLVKNGQVDNPWANVEGDRNGGEISNRSHTLTVGQQSIQSTILSFKNNISATSLTRGSLKIIEMNMPQYQDNRSRKIRIWTPDDYNPVGDKHYPVIYLHDGQNLFDRYTSFSGEWQIDEAIGKMVDDEVFDGAIVVGIDNGGGERLNELSPSWAFSSSGQSHNIMPSGEKYAAFIVETLKPYIDENYLTQEEAENTFIGGSSMGGVMSFYMTFAYPEVFNKALLFSPSMWVYHDQTIKNFLDEMNLESLATLPKVYIYAGGSETSITPYIAQFSTHLTNKGYDQANLKTHITSGAGHNEGAWASHFPVALEWLLK